MKSHARTLGLTLGNKEMIYNGQNIYVNSEEDIFRMLGLQYTPPNQRLDKLTYL